MVSSSQLIISSELCSYGKSAQHFASIIPAKGWPFIRSLPPAHASVALKLGAVPGNDCIEILAVSQVLDRNPYELIIGQLGVPWMPFAVVFGHPLEPFLLIGEHPPRNFFIRCGHWPLVGRRGAVLGE